MLRLSNENGRIVSSWDGPSNNRVQCFHDLALYLIKLILYGVCIPMYACTLKKDGSNTENWLYI